MANPKTRPRSDARALRRQFAAGMRAGLLVVWPVLSALLAAMVGLGIVAGRLLAIMIGACGILLTAPVAAVAVKALTVARGGDGDE
ncbi:MAG TPA: hypothetical protein VIQ99_10020 [Gammaproteobacteria bacterium]